MKRRGFLAGLLALPFAKPAVSAAINALERIGAPTIAAKGRSYFDLQAATACLKELYSGQVISNLVYRDNVLLMALNEPERYREHMRPVNVCRRRIERRKASPVRSGYAAWRDSSGGRG